MATGDAAAAAGIPVVPSTKDIRLGYNDINALADALALREKALADRALALEATTQYIAGTPVYASGWNDAGTKVARVGRVVTVSVRVLKNANVAVGDTLFTVPALFRPAFAEVGSVGFVSGSGVALGALTLQADGQVRFYAASTDRTVTGTITFLVE